MISCCSSISSTSGIGGIGAGKPVRRSMLGRNSSSNSPWISVGASSRQRAHSRRTAAVCSLWTRIPSEVRVSRAWPVTGPCRCSSPSRSGIGSAKSNSRTVPGPNRSNWETFTDTIGAHKKGCPSASSARSESIGPEFGSQQNQLRMSTLTRRRLVNARRYGLLLCPAEGDSAPWRASSSDRPRSTVWATWPICSRSFCSTR